MADEVDAASKDRYTEDGHSGQQDYSSSCRDWQSNWYAVTRMTLGKVTETRCSDCCYPCDRSSICSPCMILLPRHLEDLSKS